MDFSAIFQLREKRFWWMDVIFYLAISVLIAVIFCYLVFLVKNNFQQGEIKEQEAALASLGTKDQKEQESQVINYRAKVADFAGILENHEFASHAFAFMEKNTMPNVWFKQFTLDQKGASIQISGESDSLDSLSRQVASWEKNKYVSSLGGVNSSLNDSGRIDFGLNIVLDKKVFDFDSDIFLEEAVSPLDQPVPPEPGQNTPPVQEPTAQNLITSFHILLTPEVIGTINHENRTISIDVPFGTDVTNLTPAIVYSADARLLPDTNVSQNFAMPVVYKVIGLDGLEQDYIATVKVLPKEEGEEGKESQKESRMPVVEIVVGIVIAVILIGFAVFFIVRKIKNKNPEKNAI